MVSQFDVYCVDLNIRTIDKRRLKNRIAALAADEITALQDVLHQMFCE